MMPQTDMIEQHNDNFGPQRGHFIFNTQKSKTQKKNNEKMFLNKRVKSSPSFEIKIRMVKVNIGEVCTNVSTKSNRLNHLVGVNQKKSKESAVFAEGSMYMFLAVDFLFSILERKTVECMKSSFSARKTI